MSISDELMFRYYELLTEHDIAKIKAMHPKEAKMHLAEDIVDMFHAHQGRKAREGFESTFSKHQTPDDIPEIKILSGQKLLDVLAVTKIIATKNEGRRLLKEGAVTHEGKVISDEDWTPQKGVLKVGKRRFLRLT